MKVLWTNAVPNSPFSARPVLLVAQKENETTVKSFFDKLINPDTDIIDCNGISLPMGHANVNLTRCLFDGKMSWILSGVGGAHCLLSLQHLRNYTIFILSALDFQLIEKFQVQYKYLKT